MDLGPTPQVPPQVRHQVLQARLPLPIQRID